MTVVYWAELQGAGRRLGRLAARGAFNTGVHYVPGDIVTHSGTTYVALAERAPGGPTPGTDGGAGTWGALADVFGNVPQPPAPALPHLPAGVPMLRGPFIVDYSDVPHDGDKTTLWTPQAGDVLLQLFPDVQTVVQWNVGDLAIGQSLPAPPSWSWPNGKFFCFAHAGTIGIGGNGVFNGGSCLDSVADAVAGATAYAYGNGPSATGYVFHNTDPVELGIHVPGDTNPTQGHVELYALVARAVAP